MRDPNFSCIFLGEGDGFLSLSSLVAWAFQDSFDLNSRLPTDGALPQMVFITLVVDQLLFESSVEYLVLVGFVWLG